MKNNCIGNDEKFNMGYTNLKLSAAASSAKSL